MQHDVYLLICKNPGITRKEIIETLGFSNPNTIRVQIRALKKKGKIIAVRERVSGNVTRYYPVGERGAGNQVEEGSDTLHLPRHHITISSISSKPRAPSHLSEIEQCAVCLHFVPDYCLQHDKQVEAQQARCDQFLRSEYQTWLLERSFEAGRKGHGDRCTSSPNPSQHFFSSPRQTAKSEVRR
ncbi:winged helix-turn-helix transcriptional regulator [Candidatus Pyrohabitans sp.]